MKYLLDALYAFTGSYGWAIIILTIVIRLATLPLNVKQVRYSQRMQAVTPKLNKIKKKYEGDQQKINEETMKLMKDEGVNPAAGCLPLLVQLPILYALFAVLRDPATFQGFTEFFIWDITQPDQTYILAILAMATTYFQQRLTLTDPSQKMMTIIFPIMIGWFALRFPAGLALYWVVGNIIALLQAIFLKSSAPKAAEGGQ